MIAHAADLVGHRAGEPGRERRLPDRIVETVGRDDAGGEGDRAALPRGAARKAEQQPSADDVDDLAPVVGETVHDHRGAFRHLVNAIGGIGAIEDAMAGGNAAHMDVVRATASSQLSATQAQRGAAGTGIETESCVVHRRPRWQQRK
jgi:ribosomal protein L12E/L44/L45/RPP1/RPP2